MDFFENLPKYPNKKVVILGNNNFYFNTLSPILTEETSCSVEFFNTKEPFVENIISYNPDIIFFATRHCRNQINFLRENKSTKNHIIIILSATCTKEEAAELNANDIINKPIDIKILFEKIFIYFELTNKN